MEEKFLNNNKPKMSLKKRICTVSNFIDLVQFHTICQMLAKLSGVNPKGPYVSLEKKNKECLYLTYSIKRAREIRKFHFAVVHLRLRNVQKSVMQVQSCCFASIKLIAFLPLSLPSLSSLLNLHIVVVQKFCYHGNVTSFYFSLLTFCFLLIDSDKHSRTDDGQRWWL